MLLKWGADYAEGGGGGDTLWHRMDWRSLYVRGTSIGQQYTNYTHKKHLTYNKL